MFHLLTVIALAALISSPLRAQSASVEDRNKRAADSALTRQEEDFRHIIKRRDDQVEARAEVQRIINFADAAASRVNRFFDSVPSGDFAGELERRVQAALAEVDRAEAALPGSTEGRRAGRANEARVAQAPTASDASPQRPARDASVHQLLRSAVSGFRDYDHGPMVAELRRSVVELRQNLSPKHLYWAENFERLTSDWEQRLRKASGASAVELLRRMPNGPGEPNAGRYQAVAYDQPPGAAEAQSRGFLRMALDSLKGRPTVAEVRTSVSAELEKFVKDINDVGKAYDADMREVERNIARSAKDIFGANINSDIFRWLLVVFAGIFVLIMVSPMLYARTSIAENLLKAEFLLQFSTVFILTAAIIILGIGGFIKDDQLPVLLAGISGYVLGQLGKPGADIVRNAPDLARAAASDPGADPTNDNRPSRSRDPAASAQAGASRPGGAPSKAAAG